ncbi:CYFIP-related Rac1 interactor B [Ischnura elegans]|uniref:CYFIP-related Rac1 interactor B n=1 Tax=Ischnura elegans TaxID=197161 RepID=UPI001ED8A0FD|nr:CYFIP-related Rac1 interactor B [Ischnura elegans]XP_046397171.1 CYFIP-related Rac1 interactor B [Ischnura elegans]XP_046397172.1 CYFIP-related Rac1 interactor B [Ischnura elegans]XP_046397173.1 CYFIP-related Rac1 interactor B [Ischnura elegans]XP_046397174.1 CYFIP-related Rac1 interactor B [Ischnura elegans]
MGKLLSLLSRDDSNCCSPQKYDVFLDFENAQPTAAERETFLEAQAVLERSESILEEIQGYKGAGKEIREAISSPTDDARRKAWAAVIPLVKKLRRCYEFSMQLETVVPKILARLCAGPHSPSHNLETQQALVKQLAQVLEFVLKFDEHKMRTPAIQNDFSYYRRTISRRRMSSREVDEYREDADDYDAAIDGSDHHGIIKAEDTVTNELANRMSLFYAHATPMLKVLSEATTRFVAENADIPIENTTETLGTMAKVCLRMLESPNLLAQFEREETQLFVLRVMVGLVILYDHVHPQGAFVKASNVDVKGCVKLLKDQPPARSEGLLNALRYTTKHLNEEGTPRNIKNLLAA